jgi:hypothetical protein
LQLLLLLLVRYSGFAVISVVVIVVGDVIVILFPLFTGVDALLLTNLIILAHNVFVPVIVVDADAAVVVVVCIFAIADIEPNFVLNKSTSELLIKFCPYYSCVDTYLLLISLLLSVQFLYIYIYNIQLWLL